MPHRRGNANYVNDEDWDDPELAGHDIESPIWMLRYRERIESGNQTKAKIQDVKSNKEKQDKAGHSLNGIEPIAGVRIIKIVRSHLDRDHQAIDSVVD